MSDPTPDELIDKLDVVWARRMLILEAVLDGGDTTGNEPESIQQSIEKTVALHRRITALESQIALNMDYAALCAKHEKTIGDLRAGMNHLPHSLICAVFSIPQGECDCPRALVAWESKNPQPNPKP